jgi:hypothetical protein
VRMVVRTLARPDLRLTSIAFRQAGRAKVTSRAAASARGEPASAGTHSHGFIESSPLVGAFPPGRFSGVVRFGPMPQCSSHMNKVWGEC